MPQSLVFQRDQRAPRDKPRGHYSSPKGRGRGKHASSDLSWSLKFFEPIELPRGRKLATLRDAGRYIARLSQVEQRRPHWEAAARALLLVAESGGDPMLARIAMMRALRSSSGASGRGFSG